MHESNILANSSVATSQGAGGHNASRAGMSRGSDVHIAVHEFSKTQQSRQDTRDSIFLGQRGPSMFIRVKESNMNREEDSQFAVPHSSTNKQAG